VDLATEADVDVRQQRALKRHRPNWAAYGKLTTMFHKPCCDDMRWQLEFRCADHADLSDCPDSLVVVLENPARFGIRVHDGGTSFVAIRYCPWCGANLSAHAPR
jgi:hypothetical protein